MVEIAIIIMLLPFSALCVAASLYIYNRDIRERRRQLYDLSQDYDNRWQEFEAQHRGKFEQDYWSMTVNHPERHGDDHPNT